MSHRKRDSHVEKQVGDFLDCYFYPKIVRDFTRYTDKVNQLIGMDVCFSIDNYKKLIVDEKAASHYINQDIPTFAFELSFLLPSKTEVLGWFIDTSKKTEYYFLMWIKAKSHWDITKDDIQEISATLVSRKKIMDYLESISYDRDKLIRANDKIRSTSLEGALAKSKNYSVYFYSSMKLSEQPINLIIKRKVLEKIALKNFKITKQKISLF